MEKIIYGKSRIVNHILSCIEEFADDREIVIWGLGRGGVFGGHNKSFKAKRDFSKID